MRNADNDTGMKIIDTENTDDTDLLMVLNA